MSVAWLQRSQHCEIVDELTVCLTKQILKKPRAPVEDVLCDLHNASDLVLLEVISIASEYKEKALRVKCTLSSKDWRKFCVAQLSRNVGARVLHRFVNLGIHFLYLYLQKTFLEWMDSCT